MNSRPEDSQREAELNWPYVSSGDLPQLITMLFVDDDHRVAGVWWSESLGHVRMFWGAPRLTPDQLQRIASWLENWLATGPEEFTEQGRASVECMCDDIRRSLVRRKQDESQRRLWETNEFDHLL